MSKNPYENLEVQYPCPRCDKLFTKTAELYQHLRDTHPSPNRCHVCNHSFSAYASLLSHSYIHSGAKPFICGYPDCDYSCRTKQNIKVHMHFCQKCPAKKYRVPFPLPDRYKSSYKYQTTISEYQQSRNEQSKTKKRRKSKRIRKNSKSKTEPSNAIIQRSFSTPSPKKTRAWYSKNGDFQHPNDMLLKTPPTKRYIRTGKVQVEKENANGWLLEMHKCITVKSQICVDAIKLIQSQLNPKFVRSTQPKGLHIAVLRDPSEEIQSAAIINTCGNYIEIKSFATSSKHKRQHLGTMLIAFILERCHGKVIIGARDDPGVLAFWRTIGFIECPQGIICSFGRKGTVIMQTVAPYVGIYDYAISKFAPNSKVKKVLFKSKIRDENIVTYTETVLIARLHEEVTNHENKEEQNTKRAKISGQKRKLEFKEEETLALKRYCTRNSIRHL